MTLVSKYTPLRLPNPILHFKICILDAHLVNQDGHHKIFVFPYFGELRSRAYIVTCMGAIAMFSMNESFVDGIL